MDCAACHTPLPESARFCLSCGARVEPPAQTDADPLRDALEAGIGFQYRIERLLGRGGMGAVYLAHELALDRPVAIKVLPPDRSEPAMRERFKREARTAARLTHSGIVPLYTFGEIKGLLYFVMGYVEGESLAVRLAREGCLDPVEARRILRELAEALDYAHRHGVVHRDIKPDNVLLERSTGRVVLADFGIAKAARAGSALTGIGHVVGTPHYMSPEQASGKAEVDARSDLYSLGVMGYALLAGRLPFEGATAGEVLVKHMTQDPPPLRSSAPDAPEPLVTAINRCLLKDPSKRWSEAGGLAKALAASDEAATETESEEVTALRVGAFLLLLALPVRLYTALLHAMAPDLDAVVGVELARALGAIGALAVAASAIALRHRQKAPWPAILKVMLKQPGWWSGWYPRAIRRPGDVWHRLPRRIRAFHTGVGVTAVIFLFISIPIPVLLVSAQGYHARTGSPSYWGGALESFIAAQPAAQAFVSALFFLPFVALAALTAEALIHGRRLVRTLGPGLPDPQHAARALHTPSWKRSFWDKPPFDSLLLPEERASSRTPSGRRTTPTAGSEAETVTHMPESPGAPGR